ncbi:NADPH:quinone oxidoreductase family protein [Nostocaceae cyanobacterium CENA357]|uniref:NADPH:quinone oxidoreductase family protein n=1 Tax=Atlanticothrix silvestris CENA357 TaxID=1725252 RepID=A0A8J7HHX5_9CYAN|nr:NADPH:quinone oxidoreductase family protein [Atlanticothrix silvestris]MBH8552708.1 NADPH:quinone oxidoreductase family protein [Atlanticothrix silvestris CENA357]
MMKAARIHNYGGATAVRIDEIEVLPPNPGEVRIRVMAAGINNSDLQTTYGTYRGYGHQELPYILGQEAAGEVDAVGLGVKELVPGMRVVGRVRGAFAEMAFGLATELLPLADDVSFTLAASLPIAYLTAGMALIHKANVQPGEWVLIHPGSGGVGSAALQLAQLLGGRVIATAGNQAKVQRLLELGALQAIDYSHQDVVAEVRRITDNLGVQVALDGAGKVTFAHCLDAIANNGRIVSYGTTTGMDAALPLGKLLGRNATIYGIALWYNNDYQASLGTLRDLVIPAVAQGKIQPTIDEIVDLEGVSEALIKMENRDLIGKIIVVP